MSATFVLVPGGWHGAWCYRRITDLLRAAGHAVYPVTLTGLGERAHLAHREVNLDTHIADVVGVPDAEEPQDVILLGHSYGGCMISGVAERRPGWDYRTLHTGHDAFLSEPEAVAAILLELAG